jgi:clan AA aspartic protease
MQNIPKNVQAGQSVGLQFGSQGEVFINLEIINETSNKSKSIKFLIDTGFNGYLQLNSKDVADLELNLVQKHQSTGFNGAAVEVGITKAKVRVLDEEISNFPIQFVENGVNLIGTMLLKDSKKMLVIDYEDSYVTITRDQNLKKELKSSIEVMHTSRMDEVKHK